MSSSAKAWMGGAIAAAVLAMLFGAGANWRGLRDGWRLWRVRAQPDYPSLRERWQRLARAADEQRWTGPDLETGLLEHAAVVEEDRWRGPDAFLAELRTFTREAEAWAAADFAPAMSASGLKLAIEQDARAQRELVAMRARGELSDGTFSRAMLTLARQPNCFLQHRDPDALRVGLRTLCDLVDDGEARVARPPARDLGEAIRDAAGTRHAAATCAKWRAAQAAGAEYWGASHPGSVTVTGAELPEEVACRLLADLGRQQFSAKGRKIFPDHGAAWPAEPPADAESAMVRQTHGRPEERSEWRREVREAAERLPVEERGRFLSAVSLLSADRGQRVAAGWLHDERRRRRALALIAEIVGGSR